MTAATPLTPFLDRILILPRRLLLATPGVRATVPMLRGTWGAALHDRAPEAYRAVFAPAEGGGGPPPGYLLRPAPPDPRFAPAVDFFLIGDALRHDAACVDAWFEAALRGLGKERRPFEIRGSFVLGPSGTMSEERTARVTRPELSRVPLHGHMPRTIERQPPMPNPQSPTPPPPAWPLSRAVWPLDAYAPCRLVFAAPLRLRRQGRLIEEPTLADLVVAACRRIEAFLPAELQTAWRDWSDAALECAKCLPPSAWSGDRCDLHRWSARQQDELDLHGVRGRLTLARGPGELAPLLAAAQWLHLGKGTVMGLGQFQVEPEP